MNSDQNKQTIQTEDEMLDSLASAFVQIAIQQIEAISDNQNKNEE